MSNIKAGHIDAHYVTVPRHIGCVILNVKGHCTYIMCQSTLKLKFNNESVTGTSTAHC